MKTEDGRIYVIAGASRSGKTAWTLRQIKRQKRIFAWDPEDQWAQLPGFLKITTQKDMVKYIAKKGPLKLAFVVGGDLKKQFDFFCGFCMYVGRYVEPVDVIGEELADVTTQSKAPGNWGILLRRGLKRGISIWAISQRWAEADKTAIGNASMYVCFSMGGDDIRYMSRKTRIPEDDLAALKPLEFVTIDRLTKEICRGKLTF